MRPSPRPWQEEGGFCNIDELSAGGMTHLELEMERESIKPTVRVLASFFNPEHPNHSSDRAVSKCLWLAKNLTPLYATYTFKYSYDVELKSTTEHIFP